MISSHFFFHNSDRKTIMYMVVYTYKAESVLCQAWLLSDSFRNVYQPTGGLLPQAHFPPALVAND
jgi:hypothetical protein